MSTCCSTRLRKAVPKFSCPECHQTGRPVGLMTVSAIAKNGVERTDATYRFCTTPDCRVVYFGVNGRRIDKSQVKVRVGIKETEDPIPVCYCFGFTQGDIFSDIRSMGTTRIPDKICAEVKARNCECEIKNPSGSCCLGNVSRTVKCGLALFMSTFLLSRS